MDHFGPTFPFGFGLFGDRADHRFVEVHVLDLDVGHLDAPGIGLGIKHLLDIDVQPFALGQQLI
ncbi:hypothetical protein D3C73_1492580 [compost metagenome]